LRARIDVATLAFDARSKLEGSFMCCLLSALVLIGARGAGVIWWLLEPNRWSVTFNGSFIVPLLGILVLPWTTLSYVVVAPGGVDGLDFVLLGLGVVVDLASYGGGYFGNSRRTQGTAY
jgi:hypothetical protein